MTRNELEQAARDLGATGPDHGINWTWMNDFPSYDAALKWLRMITDEGYEHRGIYNPNPAHNDKGWSIRYRK